MRRWQHFDYDERNGVATLTFSRPERLNALTFDVYADIRDLTDSLRRRQDLRVLVIRGQGRGFCSGGDVDEIIAELIKRGTRDVYEFAHMTGACVRNLREIPQPVIAAVNGVAAGAGAVLAAAADIRILAESASFRFLFTSVGLSGGDRGPYARGQDHESRGTRLGACVEGRCRRSARRGGDRLRDPIEGACSVGTRDDQGDDQPRGLNRLLQCY